MYFLNFCLEGWPLKESNYTDAPISHGVSQHMPGETEILVRAEISVRMERCGKASKSLLNEILAKSNAEYIDTDDPKPEKRYSVRYVDYKELSDDGWNVVRYVSGVCRKWQECSFCRKPFNPETKKGCRSWGRKPCTFSQWVNHNR